jgi:pyrroline-5-carboxylate reductase
MRIGFIGAGNMATAILGGLASKKEHVLYAYDIDQSKAMVMKEIGVNFCSKEKLLKESEVVVLAIKPFHYQDFIIENRSDLLDKLVISIAAGITDKFLTTLLGHKNYARVMPNTPALIGKGVTAICENEALSSI